MLGGYRGCIFLTRFLLPPPPPASRLPPPPNISFRLISGTHFLNLSLWCSPHERAASRVCLARCHFGGASCAVLFVCLFFTSGEDERLANFFPSKEEGWLDSGRSFFPVNLAGFWTIQVRWMTRSKHSQGGACVALSLSARRRTLAPSRLELSYLLPLKVDPHLCRFLSCRLIPPSFTVGSVSVSRAFRNKVGCT